ncbi:hypothetical protein ABS71_01985 [bacterium SCN 62-11]|nr:hypothetical protein [Candidatus Eremiobacteraeota bacterium]ODT78290.1 MAG: hypothetical protein ABS71_01985 [bacterium SCN 62-11]
MSGNLSLDDLLQSLSHEGERDSSGQFTLDIEKAVEKVRNFQLADPYQYCLRWLQAAVVGQARLLQWRSTPLSVSCLIEGMNLPSHRIALLPGLLFESGASPAERHLSAGLNAVIKTRARAVHLTSGMLKGTWRPGGYQQVELDKPFTSVHLEIERSGGDILSQLWHAANHYHIGSRSGSPNARDREQSLLHSQGACAPLELDIQDFAPDWQLTYQEPFSLWRSLTTFSVLPETPFRQEKWEPAQKGQIGFHYRRNILRTGRKRELISIRLYILYPRYPHQCSFLYPIKDGVLLPTMKILEGRAGAIFLADVSSLHTDLTGLTLVQDQLYQQLLKELEGYLV